MPELRCHPVNELLFVVAQNFVPFVDQAEGGGRFLPFDSVVVSAKRLRPADWMSDDPQNEKTKMREGIDRHSSVINFRQV